MDQYILTQNQSNKIIKSNFGTCDALFAKSTWGKEKVQGFPNTEMTFKGLMDKSGIWLSTWKELN